jgi:hypothetical protein
MMDLPNDPPTQRTLVSQYLALQCIPAPALQVLLWTCMSSGKEAMCE